MTSHHLPKLAAGAASSASFAVLVAGDPVPAYFHQYEIVVTKPRPMQAVFMHMKEAD
jgi:hypothetical protein